MSEDIESAVTKLCADQVGGSCYDPLQSSYASMFNDELWELDEIMELSEIQNVHEHEISVDNNEDFNSKLKELSNHSIESGERIRLKVRRSCIWEDTVAKMKRVRREGLSGLVTVQFIGEPAVDEGGPRKEFFYLVHKHMQQVSGLFEGSYRSRSFTHNVMALQRDEYIIYGIISALSLLQGSPGPTMFSVPIVDYIVHGKLEAVSASVSDLPTGKVRSKLEELEAINDPVKFKQEASFNTPFRFEAGYTKPVVSFENKAELIRCICLHYLVISTLPEIDQFIEGLKTSGVLEFIRNNPNQSRKLLQLNEDQRLTAEIVDELFHFSFSEGSNKRTSEEAIAFNFTHYLEDIAAGEITTTILDPETDGITTCKVGLEHILQFVTGCPIVPATGFDTNLTCMFDHVDCDKKLTVNTCSCTLNFPVSELLKDYQSFKNEFTECIFSSPGFGKV